MTLFYHTHVPVDIRNGQILAPRFLAKEVNTISNLNIQLVLVVYLATNEEKDFCKSVLNSDIQFLFLGSHNSVIARLIRGPISLYRIYRVLNSSKKPALLIKGPTPLILFLFVLQRFASTYIFLVGDYTSNLGTLNFGFVKNRAIKILALLVDFSIKHMYKNSSLIVNSDLLHNKYHKCYERTKLVRTSTILRHEILNSRTYSNNRFKLLFVGRVEYSKGIYELVDAFVDCYNEGLVKSLDIVGPIVNNGFNVWQCVERDFKENEAYQYIDFLGPVFDEDLLRQKFQNADVFVLPSKSEGFPRVFWEAFAAGVPVITTKVGGIPMVLQNGKHAILMEDSSKNEIIRAIQRLKNNSELFNHIAHNARELAYANTVDNQIDDMMSFIKVV